MKAEIDGDSERYEPMRVASLRLCELLVPVPSGQSETYENRIQCFAFFFWDFWFR